MSWIIATLPWFIGASLALCIPYLRHICPCSETYSNSEGLLVIFAGIGGFVGYLTIAFAIWFFDIWQISLLTIESVIVGIVVLSAIFVTLVSVELARIKRFVYALPEPKFSTYALIVFLASLTLAILWQLYLLPAVAWDALDHWARVAKLLIEHLDGDIREAFVIPYIHPGTIIRIIAWSSWYENGSPHGLLPYWFFLLSGQLIVAGYSWWCCRSLFITTISTLGFTTLPLLENHTILAGYGELPLTISVLSACALIAIGLEVNSRTLKVAGVIAAFGSIALKNVGLVYAAAPLLALLTVAIASQGRVRMIYFLLAVTLVSVYVLTWGFSINLGFTTVGYNSDTNEISFASRRVRIIDASVTSIFENIKQAYLLNQSFSVSICGVVFAVCKSFSTRCRSLRFLMTTCLMLFLFLISVQLTDYVATRVTPGNDRLFSRLSIPSFAIFFLAFPLLVRESSQHDLAN